jgi:hypothetical protein
MEEDGEPEKVQDDFMVAIALLREAAKLPEGPLRRRLIERASEIDPKRPRQQHRVS